MVAIPLSQPLQHGSLVVDSGAADLKAETVSSGNSVGY